MRKLIVALAMVFIGIFYTTSIAGVTISGVPSGIDADMQICSKIENEVDRQSCIDTVIRMTYIKPQYSSEKYISNNKNDSSIVTSMPISNWKTSYEISKIDDSKNVYICTDSINPIEGKFGRDVTPRLWIRCMENKTEVFVEYYMFINTQNVTVTYRIDSEKAITNEWSTSTDHKAIFTKNHIKFIKSLFKHDNLLIRVTPYGESPRDVEFNISGLENIIEPLQRECHCK